MKMVIRNSKNTKLLHFFLHTYYRNAGKIEGKIHFSNIPKSDVKFRGVETG